MLYTILMIVLVLIAVAMIVLIMVQQGKGADAGASFGAGASSTVFGSTGANTFLQRWTYYLGTAFFAITFALAYVVQNRVAATHSVTDSLATPKPAPVAAPRLAAPLPVAPGAGHPATPAPAQPAAPGG